MTDTDTLIIYHFNDVVSIFIIKGSKSLPTDCSHQYHISDTDLIAKFAHNLTSKRDENAIPSLTIFSGDVFSPSTESSILKGEHMVPILNHLNIDVGCYGNHGMKNVPKLSEITPFHFPLPASRSKAPTPSLIYNEEELMKSGYIPHQISIMVNVA